jgi:Ca2+-binding EF-hand superfamily protein
MPQDNTENPHVTANGVNGHCKQRTYAQVCETHSKTPIYETTSTKDEKLSPLQKHVQFWDRDSDGVIWPLDVYSGFRELGFGLFFSIGSFLIPIFFSYPTRLGHSWMPDPMFRIYVKDINKAKHGSDTGIYDFDGNFNQERFEQLFDRFDSSGEGGLTADDLLRLWKKDRCAADPAGWSFAFMEWWTTYVLLQKDGLVHKDDLRACYDGSLFWRIKNEREKRDGGIDRRSFGMRNFFTSH